MGGTGARFVPTFQEKDRYKAPGPGAYHQPRFGEEGHLGHTADGKRSPQKVPSFGHGAAYEYDRSVPTSEAAA